MISKLFEKDGITYLEIDSKILKKLNITEETPLELTVENGRLIIQPFTEQLGEQRFREALESTITKFDADLRRLAD